MRYLFIICLLILWNPITSYSQLNELDNSDIFINWVTKQSELKELSNSVLNKFFEERDNVHRTNYFIRDLKKLQVLKENETENIEEINKLNKRLLDRGNKLKELIIKYNIDNFGTLTDQIENETEVIDRITSLVSGDECQKSLRNYLIKTQSALASSAKALENYENDIVKIESLIQNNSDCNNLEAQETYQSIGSENTFQNIESEFIKLGQIDKASLAIELGVTCSGKALTNISEIKSLINSFTSPVQEKYNSVKIANQKLVKWISDCKTQNANCDDERRTKSSTGTCVCKEEYNDTEEGECKTAQEILEEIKDQLSDENEFCKNQIENSINHLKSKLENFESSFNKINIDLEAIPQVNDKNNDNPCEKAELINPFLNSWDYQLGQFNSFRSSSKKYVLNQISASDCYSYYINSKLNLDVIDGVFQSLDIKALELENKIYPLENWIAENNCEQHICEKKAEALAAQLEVMFNSNKSVISTKNDNINMIKEKILSGDCEEEDVKKNFEKIKNHSFFSKEEEAAGWNAIYDKYVLQPSKQMNCDVIASEALILLTLRYNDGKNAISKLRMAVKNNYETLQNLMESNPCSTDKNNPPEEDDQGDCSSSRKEKNNAGECVCKSIYTSDGSKCLTDEELLQEAVEDTKEETENCDEYISKFEGSYRNLENDALKWLNTYNATRNSAIDFFSDATNEEICSNGALTKQIFNSQFACQRLGGIKREMDLSFYNLLINTKPCPEERLKMISVIDDSYLGAEEALDECNEGVDEMRSAWQAYGCTLEDLDQNPDASDMDRNTDSDLVGGRDRANDGIDNDGDGQTDKGPNELENDKTIYYAVRLSGGGTRKLWGGFGARMSGSQISIYSVSPGGISIDEQMENEKQRLLDNSTFYCEDGPRLCPCAPYPDIWTGEPTLDAIDSSLDPNELRDEYGCDQTVYHGRGGYVCLDWNEESIKYEEAAAGCP